MQTVDWTTLRGPDPGNGASGLRERKKRQMRQRLSDVATELFVQRGFDAVKVTDVAEACGVSEKTVYNYFPNKESLLLDRWDATTTALRSGLGDPELSPVRAALRILGDELDSLLSWLRGHGDPVEAIALFQRFGAMLHAAPALRAHQHDATDRLVAVAAEVLAGRTGLSPDDPAVQIAGTALLGLWRVQSQSLQRHMGRSLQLTEIQAAVTDDVARAARLVDCGLRALEPVHDPAP
jgi:AcrR family transcriptional regulator